MTNGSENGGDNKVEPIVILLVVSMFLLLGLLLFCAMRLPGDGQTFQVIAGLLTAFSGSLFTRIKPKGATNGGEDLPMLPPAPSKQVTKKTEETTTTAEPPKG